MKQGLEPFLDQRIRVTTSLTRMGIRYNRIGRRFRTVLLDDVCLEGSPQVIADHAWLPDAAGFEAL